MHQKALVLGLIALLVGCSEAPVVPIRPSNRVVLAELITEAG
ncbi:MAG: hypothetical protein ABIK62_00330 [candidate division WOR-3 bacterium]